jgi:tryptophan synthase alpha chain
MGVTGERTTLGARAQTLVADTRRAGAERVCVGLGVSRPEQAAEVASYADGVIVGSALVRALSEAADAASGIAALVAVTEGLAAGVRSADRTIVR